MDDFSIVTRKKIFCSKKVKKVSRLSFCRKKNRVVATKILSILALKQTLKIKRKLFCFFPEKTLIWKKTMHFFFDFERFKTRFHCFFPVNERAFFFGSNASNRRCFIFFPANHDRLLHFKLKHYFSGENVNMDFRRVQVENRSAHYRSLYRTLLRGADQNSGARVVIK